jgi:hypothetical protein
MWQSVVSLTVFDVSPDPGKLFPFKRQAIINLYIVSKSMHSPCLAGPVEKEPPVPVDEIFDRISAFLAAAFHSK